MLATLYRKLLPYSLRKGIYDFFLGKAVFFVRNFNVIAKSKRAYWFGSLIAKNDENSAYSFMGKHGLTSYPYAYSLEYRKLEIRVERDAAQNLPFVIHNSRRLYFPEFYTTEKVQKDYRALLIEQDIRSAHRYVRSYNELRGRTLLDVGAAEAIFSLDTIDLTKRVILFECLEHWQKPLQATFAKWADKVTFVKKYVGDRSEGDFVTIDEFLSGEEKQDLFIKMDIEGAERMALEGAKKTLATGKNIQLAICTYHRKGDPEYMESLMKRLGYSTEFSEGLMYWGKKLSKGVIRCKN
jgi:hypothetical protein